MSRKIWAFWSGGIENKLIVGLALLFPCALCLFVYALLLPSPSPSAVPAQAALPTTTPIPMPTDTPSATNTLVLPTATPLPPPPEEPLPTASQVVPPTATTTALPPSPPTATPEAPGLVEAQVINVVDGDTIDVLIDGVEYRVRYILVDTPETHGQPEPFGPEASAANEQLVGGKTVWLEKDVSETDRYGRLLRYVYVGDLMVNEELLRRGLAIVATFPPDVKYVDRFLAVQQQARAAGLGLWGAPVAEPAPTATPPPQQTAADVVIKHIFYDGVVNRVESDEYAEIANNGTAPIEIGGWRLNAGDPGQDFVFPGFTLGPGQVCRVYTNEDHPDSCGFSFGSGKAIWNNGGDCGYLYNTGGELVSEFCY